MFYFSIEIWCPSVHTNILVNFINFFTKAQKLNQIIIIKSQNTHHFFDFCSVFCFFMFFVFNRLGPDEEDDDSSSDESSEDEHSTFAFFLGTTIFNFLTESL